MSRLLVWLVTDRSHIICCPRLTRGLHLTHVLNTLNPAAYIYINKKYICINVNPASCLLQVWRLAALLLIIVRDILRRCFDCVWGIASKAETEGPRIGTMIQGKNGLDCARDRRCRCWVLCDIVMCTPHASRWLKILACLLHCLDWPHAGPRSK